MATTSSDEPRLVKLDPRRRVALGKVARPGDNLFLVAVDDDGVITLTPATLTLSIGASVGAK